MAFHAGQLYWPGGVNGSSLGTVEQAFVVCLSGVDGLGGGHVWLYQHTLQWLQTQWLNMYN